MQQVEFHKARSRSVFVSMKKNIPIYRECPAQNCVSAADQSEASKDRAMAAHCTLISGTASISK